MIKINGIMVAMVAGLMFMLGSISSANPSTAVMSEPKPFTCVVELYARPHIVSEFHGRLK